MTTQLKLKIKKVVAEEVRPLRHAELRKSQDFSTTSYIEDNKESTFHMASILDNKVVTCASYYPEKSLNIKSKRAYRLRGMATDSNFQRKGHASDLMQESFKELKKRDCDMVWCNARLGAVDFYKSVGFKLKGDLFDIEGIGPHYYMYKEIY
jgi:predicted GNAT family N-acyltransferase